jgi:hypothetical protein
MALKDFPSLALAGGTNDTDVIDILYLMCDSFFVACFQQLTDVILAD